MRNIITTSIFGLLACAFFIPPAARASEAPVLGMLSDAEQSYYLQVFDYSMDNTQPGQAFDWSSYSGKGKITPDKVFVSKSGTMCRNFSESYTVQSHTQDVKGVACKRKGEEGWCRLRPSNALTCAMEDPSFTFGVPNVNMPNVNMPGVNMPHVGSVNMPSVNAPNVNMPTFAGGNEGAGHRGPDPTFSGYADTVTGNAGKAAGTATSTGLSWFAKTFLR